MPDILRGHDGLIVCCRGQDNLRGKNHVTIQGFGIGGGTALAMGVRPEDSGGAG